MIKGNNRIKEAINNSQAPISGSVPDIFCNNDYSDQMIAARNPEIFRVESVMPAITLKNWTKMLTPTRGPT